ncbi:MAG: hypothetical protein LBK59_01810 [Bifidobacteriaceae bacterium]|jgi:hypothetical protein|nr:hypothetical protein [Bifidobacteriaceae bacterium]
MKEEASVVRRVRFFGPQDLSVGWYVARVAQLVEEFAADKALRQVMDIIELHNVQQFLEHDFLPRDHTPEQRAAALSRIPEIQSAVARFFFAVDDANCASLISEVDYEYHRDLLDLLDLLGRYKAFERCRAETMLPALKETGIHLGEMLGSKRLVAAYDAEIRDELVASPVNGEHLVCKHMQNDGRHEVHLPRSLSAADSRDLLERYLDSAEANPNYVSLVELAPISAETGVDAKLKLRAKRRNAELTQKFFENNAGFKIRIEVRLSDTQDEPVQVEMRDSDGSASVFTYSSRWLDETFDNPSILNNFQHLFEFADQHVVLTLPSYQVRLGVLERLIGEAGKTHYETGVGFYAVDRTTFLQTCLYQHYLNGKGKDLENVISWFFEEYLAQEFSALNFSFRPSSPGASYLERVRQLFAEMESAMAQFGLYVENGELDRDLLAITSYPVRYKKVPSMLPGKYVYPTKNSEITGILHAMFSDQSTLTYINDELTDDNAAGLLRNNHLAQDDFHEYQIPVVRELVTLGVLEDAGGRVRIADVEQILVLRGLFETEACSYYHLSDHGRAVVDAMEARGWVERRSSLLTEAEGQYLNYFLNKIEFSNGRELRNKFLHGSQTDEDGEDAHFRAYITALRLMIALLIKVNDDFWLLAAENSSSKGER